MELDFRIHKEAGRMRLTEDMAKANLQSNLSYLMEKNAIRTKKEMAAFLDVSLPTLSNVMNEGQIPNIFPFFVSAKEKFGYTMDELLCQDIRLEEEKAYTAVEGITEKRLSEYLGLFMVYHFKTTAFKGRERSSDEDALRAGVLLVTRDPDHLLSPRVTGTFGLKKVRAEELYHQMKEMTDQAGPEKTAAWFAYQQSEYHVYKGEARIMESHIHYTLNYEDRDRVTMIFHQTKGNEEYLGGLGAMLSLGKGRYPDPCMQNAGLVRGCLPCSSEMIAQNLLTHYPNLKAYDQVEELCSMLTALYSREENEESLLTAEEKRVMVLHHIDRAISVVVENNLFRLYSITGQDDDEFYHFIKKAFKVR